MEQSQSKPELGPRAVTVFPLVFWHLFRERERKTPLFFLEELLKLKEACV